MNHYVPDFEMDEDYLLQDSSNSKRHKKSTIGDEDIMELLWQNGQVVMQSQNQRSTNNKRSETTPSGREIRSGIDDETTPCNLFMQEDEMVSWLHYPNDDNNLDLYLHYNDLMYSSLIPATSSQPPQPPAVQIPSPKPPIPPLKRVENETNRSNQAKTGNFLHFSRPNKLNVNLAGSGPVMTQSTVVESNDRPANDPTQSRVSRVTDSTALVSGSNIGYSFGAGASSGGREPEMYDLSASSSPGTGGSGASASVERLSSQKPPPVRDDRKGKGVDTDDTECCYSEDVEFEYHEAKKQKSGSTSVKRTRAAEVHNLSERRRRDRINEKMKALQDLIPRCNKSDKASMLDEAIEYLKSLQMQVQMMSMGYNMVPMMFPGVQRYMPTMAPMGMGMGMGMDHVGMNRPMVPYPPGIPGSAIPNPAAAAAAAAHLGPRFPVPRFQMAQVPVMGPAGSQTVNPSDPMMNSFPMQNASQPRVPFADPYQQYIGLPQTQMLQPQNQAGMPAVPSKPSSSKDAKDPEHHPTG